jgi:hypothetical protein
LRNKSAKTNPLVIIAVIAGIVILLGSMDLSGILDGFEMPFSAGTLNNANGGVPVNKKVQFAFTDKYSGSALGSKTITVYDAQTFASLHSLTTTSAGIANTTVPYESGTELLVKYETSNDKKWFEVTVPYMNENDAEAETYNIIPLQMFAIGTYTSDTLMVAGTAINDAGEYNHTASGSNPTFSYTLANSGSDNTGLDDSYDPIYDCNYETWVTVKFSGTNYETVVLKGFDNKFTLGSAQYGADQMNSDALSKWKVGTDYISGYVGTDTVTFSLDMSGYTGNSTTMQITAYAYADPDYARENGGSFGPEIVEIAEQTVTLST